MFFFSCNLGQQKQFEPVKYQRRYESAGFWHFSIWPPFWNWRQTGNANPKQWRCSLYIYHHILGTCWTFRRYHLKTTKFGFHHKQQAHDLAIMVEAVSRIAALKIGRIPSHLNCKGAENVLPVCSSCVGSSMELEPLSLGPFVLSANLCRLLSKSKSKYHHCSVAPLSWTLNGPL